MKVEAMKMVVPVKMASLLLVLLILTAQIFPKTNSYQGGNIATQRSISAPNGKANTDGEHEAAVIGGFKLNGVPQMIYTEKVKDIFATKKEKVALNVKGEQIMSRRPLSQSGRKDRAGHVAFTADYKSPRHHPPKHN